MFSAPLAKLFYLKFTFGIHLVFFRYVVLSITFAANQKKYVSVLSLFCHAEIISEKPYFMLYPNVGARSLNLHPLFVSSFLERL